MASAAPVLSVTTSMNADTARGTRRAAPAEGEAEIQRIGLRLRQEGRL
jgi:hypothetical protein